MACVTIGSTALAQQDPQFTQYMFDRLSINPAYAGSTGNICATALMRQQWSGFSGAPRTGLINIHGPINSINSGIGLSVYMDKLGQQNSTMVRLSYAYHFKLTATSTLSLGLYGGLASRSLGNSWVATDPVADDNVIPSVGRSNSGFDMGAGVYYKGPKAWAGLSSTQLPQTEFKDVSMANVRHYYAQGGFDWWIGGNRMYTLQPSVLVKSDGTSTQFDLSALFLYNDKVWAGASFRTEDAIAPMIGYQHTFAGQTSSMLRIGYAYDVTTSELRNYSSGGHEILLSYCFNVVRTPPTSINRHPLFL